MIQQQTLTVSAQAVAKLPSQGLQRGTEVMTLAGIRPVESLHKGDRIVTRTGARQLKSVERASSESFQLVFERPQIVFLAKGQVHGETGEPFAA